MRTWSRIAIVAAALAALVAALAATPLGWRLAARGLRTAVAGAGLDLEVGSLRGNLFRHVTLEGLALREPGGAVIASASKIEAEYRLGPLTKRRVVVPKLRVEGAELLFEVGTDGKLVGWSRFAKPSGEPARPTDERAWTADVEVEIDNLRATFRNAAAGLAVEAVGVAVRGRGGPQEYEASAEGAFSVLAEQLAHDVAGDFALALRGEDGRVTLTSSRIASNVGSLGAKGTVAGAPLSLAFDASVDLAALASALGVPDLSGTASSAGTVSGSLDSVAFAARVSGRDLVFGATEVPSLEAEVSGTPRSLAVDRLVAAYAGGTVEATLEAALGESARGIGAVDFEVGARGLDLTTIAAALPDSFPRISGTLSASVQGSASEPRLTCVRALFDAQVPALGVADVDAGPVEVSGGLDQGRLTLRGSVLASELRGAGALVDSGLVALDLEADLSDLSVPAAAFGSTAIAGQGRVTAHVTEMASGPVVAAEAFLPDLRVADVQAGPVSVLASGRVPTLQVSADAFSGSLTAEGALGEGGAYSFAVSADSLLLSWAPPESARSVPALEAEITADVSVRSAAQGGFAAEGSIADLGLSVGSEQLRLAHPARFSATEDSLGLSSLALSGPLGAIAIGGTFDRGGENNVIVRLDSLDLARTAALAPAESAPPLSGRVDGTVTLLGSGRDRWVAAEVGGDSLSIGGVNLDAVAVSVESDSTDIYFDVSAQSADGGSMAAFGAVPVKPDSLRVLVLDNEREFGVTVTWSRFAVSAGEGFLPRVRGEKRFEIDGSVLLSGTVDSLATIYGRGLLEVATAEFEEVEFSLASPLEVEVAGGDIELPGARVVAKRRRVLGEADGGALAIAGSVGHDGALDLDVSVEQMDVGRLIDAFAPDAGPLLTGRLDGRAELRGTVTAPEGAFHWVMPSPVIYDVGFLELSGDARMVPGALILDRVDLSAPGGTVSASGTVPTAPDGTGPALDVGVSIQSFDLAGLPVLPAGLGSLEGRLSADVRATGTRASPVLTGSLLVQEASASISALADPIKDIHVEAVLDSGTVALTVARASLGRGSVSISGFAQIAGEGERPFLFRAELDSPDIEIPKLLEARFGGGVTWSGSATGSQISGDVQVERLDVTYSLGLTDLLTAKPVLAVRPSADDPRSRIALDVDLVIVDQINIASSLADLGLAGGLHLGGTLLTPQLSGGVYAERGEFRYLENTFSIEELSVAFTDRRRRDPHIQLEGEAEVVAKTEEEYTVTLRLNGFAFDVVPELTSVPPLSEPDIVSLLTFGDTVGSLMAGGSQAGSSGESWSALAKTAFLGSLMGVAQGTMEDLLRLDTVRFESGTVEEEEGTVEGATNLVVGKRFGDRLAIEYRTTLGHFDETEIEVALKIIDALAIESRSDPEGNNSIGLRLRIPFR